MVQERPGPCCERVHKGRRGRCNVGVQGVLMCCAGCGGVLRCNGRGGGVIRCRGGCGRVLKCSVLEPS